MMDYKLHFGVIWANYDKLLSGLALGVVLAAVAVGIGTLIGLVCAFARLGRSRSLRVICTTYVALIRNTPLLLLVLLSYFALPELGIVMGKEESFVAALSLYSGAYLSEVFRAGLLSVPVGVVEAGRAIGLNRFQVGTYVVGPIMLRNALPSLGNTFISMFKNSSLAAAIAVPELTFEARRINVDTFRVVEAWTAASALYVTTCVGIAALLRWIERRFPRF